MQDRFQCVLFYFLQDRLLRQHKKITQTIAIWAILAEKEEFEFHRAVRSCAVECYPILKTPVKSGFWGRFVSWNTMHFHRGCGGHCGSKGAYGWEISILKALSPTIAGRLPAAVGLFFWAHVVWNTQRSYGLADVYNKSGRWWRTSIGGLCFGIEEHRIIYTSGMEWRNGHNYRTKCCRKNTNLRRGGSKMRRIPQLHVYDTIL